MEEVTLKEYYAKLREADERFHAERDRRYAEVALEREKALKIKEEADKAALSLARDIQVYKDEKANELRSQIERERGSYATKSDLSATIDKLEATIKPLSSYMAAQQGKTQGLGVGWSILVSTVLMVVGVVTVILLL